MTNIAMGERCAQGKHLKDNPLSAAIYKSTAKALCHLQNQVKERKGSCS